LTPTDCDVAIVGYGPVGATLAGLLGRLGVATQVFESTTSVHHLPRAAHFDGEIMRVFQQLGIAEALEPLVAPVRGMHFVNAAGERLLAFDLPDGVGRHGYPDGFMFYQPELEAELRSAVDQLLSVEAHLGHEVLAVEQCAPGASLSVLDLTTGQARTVTARYVVGADGGRSLVRRSGDFGSDDLGFDQPWLVVDTVLKRPVDLPELVLQICDPARPTTFVPMANGRRRWEFMLLPGEDPIGMQRSASIRGLLQQFCPHDDLEIVRAAVYRFHAVIARRWRDGALLVAGDAAHQMPPFLGQGMCSGIRDAANLAWKLGLVLGGRCGESLLDTYGAEREPHVRAIVELAVALGGILQTLDPDEAAARDRLMLDSPTPPPASPMPPLAPGIFVQPSGGGICPQPALPRPAADAVLLDDLSGDSFSLVLPAGTELGALPPWLDQWWRDFGGRIVELPTGTELGYHEEQPVLVRPDRYIFGAGDPVELVTSLHDALALHPAGAPTPTVGARPTGTPTPTAAPTARPTPTPRHMEKEAVR
jgi:3-(3-hydroxy-phenyl)propionate hydroxylase